ncbi:MAG: DAK2 domain-containing protein, partial [Trueperaceae bacterium]|nr:DAK2 domain-containing protein [Trueperaceae bacterium]
MTDAAFADVWADRLAARFAAEEERLGALDALVGDGDHGATMARAFAAAATALATDPAPDLADRLAAIGRAVTDAAGGASGPLTAGLFLSLAQAVREHRALEPRSLAAGLAAARDLVVRMGRCAPGDKTLLDALAPAADAAATALARGDDLTATWAAAVGAAAGALAIYVLLIRDLPDFRTLGDYRPPVVSEVFDREGRVVGEFYTQKRRLV